MLGFYVDIYNQNTYYIYTINIFELYSLKGRYFIWVNDIYIYINKITRIAWFIWRSTKCTPYYQRQYALLPGVCIIRSVFTIEYTRSPIGLKNVIVNIVGLFLVYLISSSIRIKKVFWISRYSFDLITII